METLRAQLDDLIKQLPDEAGFRETLDSLKSVYPFNEFEYIISVLLGSNILQMEDYYELRDSYIFRNLYLYIFEIGAPRVFGETWAQGHLKELIPTLERPSKKLDPSYSGQYDFYLDNKIRIEVKASRAVAANSDAPLYVKALASDSPSPFWMNFQQVKPACCDVFVWIAVWRDKIKYWILASHEVEHHLNYSKGQHRGNQGEGQLHIKQDNIRDFDGFLVASDKLMDGMRTAYQQEVQLRKAEGPLLGQV